MAGAEVSVSTDFFTPTATTAATGAFRVGRIVTGRHTWCVKAPRYADTCGTSVTITSGKTAKLGTVVLKRES